MMHFDILNSKQRKNIKKILIQKFDCEELFLNNDYTILKTPKDKIYFISSDFIDLDYEKLRIDIAGIYIAKKQIDYLRLSLEGAQLIGPYAKKSIIVLKDNADFESWLKGFDLEFNDDQKEYYSQFEDFKNQFCIIKYGSDFIGCALFKGDKLFNYISKNRRLKVVNDGSDNISKKR